MLRNNVKRIFKDFLNLIYPDLCCVCERNLVSNEHLFCTPCLADMPFTRFQNTIENPVAQLFWGRAQVQLATSLFYFAKGSKYRGMMHKFKYQGHQWIGYELGNMLGAALLQSDFSNATVIVPVPLHPSKLRKRGFNQSKVIADGMARKMHIPVIDNGLERRVNTSSQTTKGRYDRWLNVEDIFDVPHPELFASHNILLVDDIVTTGATIEACANAIQTKVHCNIMVATLAYTEL